ncbi:MAG: hypothetical protein K0V04_38915 [Deltaproteobacteria bacterium]|nr:hypothetical protein [Deltaproteobacteria bacterium]
MEDSHRSNGLSRLYLGMGLAGIGFAIFYLVVAWKIVTDGPGGPNDIGLVLLVVVLLLAQATPGAGLVALAALRRGDRPWSGAARAWMVAGVIMAVAMGLFVFIGALVLIPIGGSVLLMGSRLAARNRAWIATWLIGSTAIMVVNGLFVAWWISLP